MAESADLTRFLVLHYGQAVITLRPPFYLSFQFPSESIFIAYSVLILCICTAHFLISIFPFLLFVSLTASVVFIPPYSYLFLETFNFIEITAFLFSGLVFVLSLPVSLTYSFISSIVSLLCLILRIFIF